MKIIFCDIDGVLNACNNKIINNIHFHKQLIKKNIPIFKYCLNNLKFILTSVKNSKIIWTSLWTLNKNININQWKSINNNFKNPFIFLMLDLYFKEKTYSIVLYKTDNQNKYSIIFNYIDNNLTNTDKFVILDDKYIYNKLHKYVNNIVLCNNTIGLTKYDAEVAISIIQ